MIELTNAAARVLLLAAQGLHRQPDRSATKADVLVAIRRMCALQIDTINVVARSPYLVLWSRLGEYDPCWLDELLAEVAVFENWSHEACFLPIEDYPIYRRLMLDGRARSRGWISAHPDDTDRVLALAHERGEIRSVDFERTDGRKGTWWDWKPEKRALECLLSVGDLMVARREKFQRVYAPRERVLPAWDDANAPSGEYALRTLTLRAVKALGVATARWVPDYFRTKRDGVEAILEHAAEVGEVSRARVEGIEAMAYVHQDNLALAEAAASGGLDSELTLLLSPFDPVVWDRARTEALFGFRYRLECYTPADKRQFGYYSLPVLHRGALIGRLTAKAHRKDGFFEVRALHLEPEVEVGERMVAELASALEACAAWHRTPEVVVRATEPAKVADLLAGALGSAGTQDGLGAESSRSGAGLVSSRMVT